MGASTSKGPKGKTQNFTPSIDLSEIVNTPVDVVVGQQSVTAPAKSNVPPKGTTTKKSPKKKGALPKKNLFPQGFSPDTPWGTPKGGRPSGVFSTPTSDVVVDDENESDVFVSATEGSPPAPPKKEISKNLFPQGVSPDTPWDSTMLEPVGVWDYYLGLLASTVGLATGMYHQEEPSTPSPSPPRMEKEFAFSPSSDRGLDVMFGSPGHPEGRTPSKKKKKKTKRTPTNPLAPLSTPRRSPFNADKYRKAKLVQRAVEKIIENDFIGDSFIGKIHVITETSKGVCIRFETNKNAKYVDAPTISKYVQAKISDSLGSENINHTIYSFEDDLQAICVEFK